MITAYLDGDMFNCYFNNQLKWSVNYSDMKIKQVIVSGNTVQIIGKYNEAGAMLGYSWTFDDKGNYSGPKAMNF